MKHKVVEIDINKLYIDELNDFPVDKDGDEWALFVENLKEEGIFHPLVVNKTDSKYGILSGQRRFLAAKEIGLKTVPCVVKKVVSYKSKQNLIIDLNIHNRHLTDMEITKYFKIRYGDTVKRAIKSGKDINKTIKALSKKSGLSVSKVKFRFESIRNKMIEAEFKKTKGKKAMQLLSVYSPAKRKRVESLIKICLTHKTDAMQAYAEFKKAYAQLKREIVPQSVGVSAIQATTAPATKASNMLSALGVPNFAVGSASDT